VVAAATVRAAKNRTLRLQLGADLIGVPPLGHLFDTFRHIVSRPSGFCPWLRWARASVRSVAPELRDRSTDRQLHVSRVAAVVNGRVCNPAKACPSARAWWLAFSRVISLRRG